VPQIAGQVFYSDDLRALGRTARRFENLISSNWRQSIFSLEGTTLSRPDSGAEPETEKQLEQRVISVMKGPLSSRPDGLLAAKHRPLRYNFPIRPKRRSNLHRRRLPRASTRPTRLAKPSPTSQWRHTRLPTRQPEAKSYLGTAI
jgi:hypothetical protein